MLHKIQYNVCKIYKKLLPAASKKTGKKGYKQIVSIQSYIIVYLIIHFIYWEEYKPGIFMYGWTISWHPRLVTIMRLAETQELMSRPFKLSSHGCIDWVSPGATTDCITQGLWSQLHSPLIFKVGGWKPNNGGNHFGNADSTYLWVAYRLGWAISFHA